MTDIQTITLGQSALFRTRLYATDPDTGAQTPTNDDALELRLTGPSGEQKLTLGDGITSGADTGEYYAIFVPDETGEWPWRWDSSATVDAASEGLLEVVSIYLPDTTDPRDIRVMVPRVRRAVEGVARAEWKLTADEVKDLVADSVGDVILYTGSAAAGGFGTLFGKILEVTQTDRNLAPVEYRTSAPLSLPEQSVVASQAALNYFFHLFSGTKVAETIADEASHYSWQRSPQLLTAQLKLLQEQRDTALEAIGMNEVLESYVSFVAVRDTTTSRYIEPWVWGHPEGYGVGAGGLQGDFRFDSLATGGGDFLLGN